ncbi:MAG: trypsin-like peptidase domain-containing protein [Bradymonadales bacterium]|nr:trypsin-like peptidase domain-containing protein [Bradymonadales bacterium]
MKSFPSLVPISLALSLMVPLLSSCEGIEPTDLAIQENPVIYGTDSREQPFDAENHCPAMVGVDQVAAIMIDRDDLAAVGDDDPPSQYYLNQLAYGTLGDYYDLCSWEPFEAEPVPGWCSGFLVGGPNGDLLVTAGHCIVASECSQRAWVFDYRMQSDTRVPDPYLDRDNVYFCAEVVDRVENSKDDWAIVRLDRPVVGRTPIPLRRSGAVESDPAVAGLMATGFPGGMPMKVVGGPTAISIGNINCHVASVTDTDRKYFESNLDMYAGNSGSLVVSLDSSGAVVAIEGVLVRGNPDYDLIYSPSEGYCQVSNVCDESGCTRGDGSGWEEITRATNFSFAIYCGDMVCDGPETSENCPEDCGSGSFCGDHICDPGETPESCPEDCAGSCLPSGAACTLNSECCSQKCKGKPGSRTCQ